MKTHGTNLLVHFLLWLLPTFVFASIYTGNIKDTEPDWTTVLSGKALATPQSAPYGFVVPVDRNTIAACTGNGTILWQHEMKGSLSPFFAVISDGFVCAVTDTNRLSLINPSGLLLWTAYAPFSVTAETVQGRDDRLFARGRNGLACYGMNGICKWTVKTETQANLPLQELNDGSLLVFLEKSAGSQSEAIRISPFGAILGHTTFSGTAVSALSCHKGILVFFSDGSYGLCSIPDSTELSGTCSFRIFSGTVPTGEVPSVIHVGNRNVALLYQSGTDTVVRIINSTNGSPILRFTIPDFRQSSLTLANGTQNNLLLADTSSMVRCSFSKENGSPVWRASLPDRNSGPNAWNYLYCTSEGTAVLCGISWALSGYHTAARLPGEIFCTDKGYPSFFTGQTVSETASVAVEKRIEVLKKGLYGEKEAVWTRELQTIVQAALEYRREKLTNVKEELSPFEADRSSFKPFFGQLGLYGTSLFSPMIASLIDSEPDPAYKALLAQTAGVCAYDPGGKMLDSLAAAAETAAPGNQLLLITICDAVYDICRFMGRTAFSRKGKDVLSRLLYPQYDRRTTDYVRKTLGKLASLGI